MKTIKEVIEETLEYYSNAESRGINPDYTPVYKSPAGCMCAVGRCMKEPEKFLFMAIEVIVAYRVFRDENEQEYLDSILKDEYKGIPLDFWIKLQRWHDNGRYWAVPAGKLNEIGKVALKELEDEFEGN